MEPDNSNRDIVIMIIVGIVLILLVVFIGALKLCGNTVC